LNNRIATLERAGRFAEAVPLAIDRAALLHGNSLTITNRTDVTQRLFEDPRVQLLNRLLNYGSSFLRANREEDALRWASAASIIYPDDTSWQEFIMSAVNNRVVRFTRDRRFRDAANFLESNRELLSDENYRQLHTLVSSNLATDYHNRFAASWNRGNYDEAMRILNEGLAEFPDSSQLLNAMEIVNRHNTRN
jgi:tetratricopeptide (TPR) repeat protein